MQDIAGRSLLRVRCERWTAFGNTRPMAPIRLCRTTPCAILAGDVNPFVCCLRLDGDRRFEVRFSRKFPL
jgi:hypothetical protein